MTRTIAVLACMYLLGQAVDAATSCDPLTAEHKSALSKYVKQKYRAPDDAVVIAAEETQVPDTCYRRLRFRAADPHYHFDVILYLSPDQRFLTADLNDTKLDPLEEDRRRTAELRHKLEDGVKAWRGPADAPVSVVVFSDFECPFCAQLAKGFASDIFPSEGNKIRFGLRYFPLGMHPWAKQAAQAAACATEQGGASFWELHDYFFQHQGELTPGNLTDKTMEFIGGEKNFDLNEFKSCLSQNESAAAVEKDVSLGRELGISATPTLFINGQEIVGYQSQRVLALIRALAAAAKQ